MSTRSSVWRLETSEGERKVLDALLRKLENGKPGKPVKRPVLRKPQQYVVGVGEILSMPTMAGKCANPYYPDWVAGRFRPMAFGAAIILGRGRAFRISNVVRRDDARECVERAAFAASGGIVGTQ